MGYALTLARPYARAAFAVAIQHKQQDMWAQLLEAAALIASDPGVSLCLRDPTLSFDDRLQFFILSDQCPLYTRFLKMLMHAHRLDLLPEIQGVFMHLLKEAAHIVQARITTALALSQQQQQDLIAALEKRFSRKIEITLAVDPSLIGGAVIAADDVIIDGSVRGKIAQLKHSFAS